MKQQHVDYQVVPYPKIRRFMAVEFRSSHHTPIIHGLIEVDVSKARAFLREHKAKNGESLSFTAFLIACLAIALRESLSLTISFDHDIIDGAPAARFTQRLKELIESGYGLPNSTVESEPAEAEAAAQKS